MMYMITSRQPSKIILVKRYINVSIVHKINVLVKCYRYKQRAIQISLIYLRNP